MLIFAYADWCGHCQNFKPIWNQFKTKYAKILDIREVNADKDKAVIQNMGVRGFPTIVMLHNGTKHEFEGPRTVQGLENFVKNVVNSHTKENLKNLRSR